MLSETDMAFAAVLGLNQGEEEWHSQKKKEEFEQTREWSSPGGKG